MKSRNDIITEISKQLAEKRKAQNIELKSITQNLKIRVQFLEAMENGQWDELPGEVYIRGFVMKFAEYLGMNGAELIQPYLDLNKVPEENNTDDAEEFKHTEISKATWIFAGLVIILFVGLIKFLKPNKIPSSEPVIESQQTVKLISLNAMPVISETVEMETHVLEVFSPEALWLRVKTEEKTFEGFIPELTTWSWQGKGEFAVRLGHSRQVTLQFDGQPIILRENQKRLRLPHES